MSLKKEGERLNILNKKPRTSSYLTIYLNLQPTYLSNRLMKKLLTLFMIALAGAAGFSSCSKSKTYAEQLEDEQTAIKKYIANNKIKVITEEEFLKDTITDVAQNEFVKFNNGTYLQIIRRCGAHSLHEDSVYNTFQDAPEFKNGNSIMVRYAEYDIKNNYLTAASNYSNPVEYCNAYPDEFKYTIQNSTNFHGEFLDKVGTAYYYGMGMGVYYGSKVPQAWLIALQYVHDGAHIKVIAPSKLGHESAAKYVAPYFYEIRSLYIN